MKNELNLKSLPIDVVQEIAEALHSWSGVHVFYNKVKNTYDVSTSIVIETKYNKDIEYLGSIDMYDVYTSKEISYFSQKAWANVDYR